MEPAPGKRIKVTEDGPYLVSGGVHITKQIIACDDAGESERWDEEESFEDRESCGLCRCGESQSKPFCDGTHARIHFDGTETASRASYAEQAVRIQGPVLELDDVKPLCAEARFCHRGGGEWNRVKDCDAESVELVVRESRLCPSGRYVAVDKTAGSVIEPELPPSIGLVEDPTLGVSGPLWVRGGIRIESADGEPYEVRNRVTLCRCGRSANKPFCDGTHIEAGFKDGL
jgi:CDGSH-type Zn-finger protein